MNGSVLMGTEDVLKVPRFLLPKMLRTEYTVNLKKIVLFFIL